MKLGKGTLCPDPEAAAEARRRLAVQSLSGAYRKATRGRRLEAECDEAGRMCQTVSVSSPQDAAAAERKTEDLLAMLKRFHERGIFFASLSEQYSTGEWDAELDAGLDTGY